MKKLVLFVIILSILALAACGAPQAPTSEPDPEEAPVAEEAPAFDLEAFKATASELRAKAGDTALLLSNMAQYEGSYLEIMGNIGGTVDYSEVYGKAVEWLEEKSDYTETDLTALESELDFLYIEILSASADDGVAQEISTQSKAIYEAVVALRTAVESSGENLASRVNAAIADYQNADSVLAVLLGENE